MKLGTPVHSTALVLAALAELAMLFKPLQLQAAQNPPPSAGSAFPSDPSRVGIPTQPSAPPSLSPKKATGVIRCQRFLMYRGQRLDCDSNLEQDGERLRPIIKDVPSALAELDRYQWSKGQVRQLSYAGGLGLGMILAGFVASRSTVNSQAALDYRVMGIGGGLIVLGVSLVSGLATLNRSSEHLGNAVKEYNQARPADPVELQFSTGFEF